MQSNETIDIFQEDLHILGKGGNMSGSSKMSLSELNNNAKTFHPSDSSRKTKAGAS